MVPPSRASARIAFAPIEPGGTGIPLYRAVKRALIMAIETGEAPPGSVLPSETALAAAFRVSIGTLRRAVDELVAEHLLARRQGRGTFVATHGTERFPFRFFHVERGDGLREQPQVELIGFERVRLEDEAAEVLAVRPGDPGLQIDNRLALQGRPVVHDRLLLPAALFRGLTEKRLQERPSTIYQLYQSAFGITVVRAHERVRATACDRSSARVLGLAPATPVLQVRRTALTFGDKPVELRISTINTARHDYVHMLNPST